jgi:hypothetical protein
VGKLYDTDLDDAAWAVVEPRQRPFFIGKPGWVRSSAWIWLFSSIDSTTACAAQVPNAVSDADFAELKKHYTDAQIVDIVAVISLFGFLNRFNDTMATELEAPPIEAGKRFLAEKGWSVGKHAA